VPSDGEAETEVDGVSLALTDGVPSEAEADGDPLSLADGVPSEGLAETDWDGLVEGDAEIELLGETDGDDDWDVLGEAEILVLSDWLGLVDGVPSEGLAEADWDGLTDGDAEIELLCDWLGLVDGVPSEGLAEIDWDGLTEGDDDGVEPPAAAAWDTPMLNLPVCDTPMHSLMIERWPPCRPGHPGRSDRPRHHHW
jgi:hypothetical protein